MKKTISLTEDVIEAIDYFRKLGYTIIPDFLLQFFTCIANFPDQEKVNRQKTSDYGDLLRALLVQNEEEFLSFDRDFQAFLERRPIISREEYAQWQEADQKAQLTCQKLEKEADQYLKKAEEAKQTYKQYEELSKQNKRFTQEEINHVHKLMIKYGEKLASLMGMSVKKLTSLYDNKNISKKELSAYQKKLEKGLMNVLMSKDYKQLMSLYKELMKMTKLAYQRLEDQAFTMQKAKDTYEKNCRCYEKTLQLLESSHQSLTPVAVVKSHSQKHRYLFLPGHQVSINDLEMSDLLNQPLEMLSEDDFTKLKDYLREHAQQFRTRLDRYLRTTAHHRIDFPLTCQKACATDGIPIRLEKVKPKKQKTSLVMFLDVSGSCHNASAMMLQFMGCMVEVFGGGCHCFAFVDHLYDVTDAFINQEEISSILSRIPTKGVYSNYELPLRQFCDESLSLITKDTIVIFIGDMRNNQNPTGEEMMKSICRKAKNAYMINTEEERYWNIGDSIVSVYQPYMRRVQAAVTPAQLFSFLMEVK